MSNWENIRKKVDSDAEDVRKKSEKGKLISQQEAALVREAELYAQIDQAQKRKQKEKEKEEKLLQKIERVDEAVSPDEIILEDGLEGMEESEQCKVEMTMSKSQFARELKNEANKKHVHRTMTSGQNSSWFGSLSQDGEKRRDAILSRFPTEETFIKYENGFPVDDFSVKKIITANELHDDRILISRSGIETEMSISELDELASEKGFIKLSKYEKKKPPQHESEISEEQKERLRERFNSMREMKNEEDLDSKTQDDIDGGQKESELKNEKNLRGRDYEKFMDDFDESDQDSVDHSVDSVFQKMEAAHFDFLLMTGDQDREARYGDNEINTEQKKFFDEWVIEKASEEYVAKRYLSYNDVLKKNIDDITVHESAKKYATSLKKLVNNEQFFGVATKLKQQFFDSMKNLDIKSSAFGKSDSWVYWDMAKQQFFLDHQELADDRYDIGNPLENESLQKQIINRHVGWEVYGILGGKTVSQELLEYVKKNFSNHGEIVTFLNKKPKNNGTLSSFDLMKLGEFLREGLV